MKTIVTLIALIAGLAFTSIAEETGKTGTLRHVVALKFKEGTSTEDIKKVETVFRDLKKTIPQISALEWGTNVSPEKHAKGFTHCFVLTFKSEKDRDDYLPHPEHKKFGKVLGPVMAEVFVIDYWAKE